MSILDVLKQNQLDIMLVLEGICFAITVCGLFSHTSGQKKMALLIMGIASTFLIVADRNAYIFRGDRSEIGYWMVRISNFAVFYLTLLTIQAFNWYLIGILKDKNKGEKTPLMLVVNEGLLLLGVVLLIVSQFTGLYYTFDENNFYQRSDLYFIAYLIPAVVWVLQSITVIQNRKKLNHLMLGSLLVFSMLPVLASLVQFFCYGLSVTNTAVAVLTVALRLIEIINTNNELEASHKREKELMSQKQEDMSEMIEETAYALAAAIDAKDEYTHGHSARVAHYSRKIAKKYGMDKKDCRNIYLAALLHDVGKIGIPESIINKDCRLTDEENDVIKTHTVIGYQILKKIQKNPELCIGAHYHHERYDGTGYPEGLKGDDIPLFARIIAVADTYDAMTSKRSYRDVLPQDVVRAEIEKGSGTQFDPGFADIMLKMIDDDKRYRMRQM